VSWLLWTVGGLVALYIAMGIYLAVVLKWEDERTVGLNYYGRSLEDRERFKRTLTLHAALLAPMLWLNGRGPACGATGRHIGRAGRERTAERGRVEFPDPDRGQGS
jgi:hypothetical protein